MILKKTNSDDPGFQKLVIELDRYLAFLDGEEHEFYAQLNKSGTIKHVLLAYENDQPVGCGAIRKYPDGSIEVKRMYVPPAHRGKGIAKAVLSGLEDWAKSLGFSRCILETGIRQPQAIGLYRKCGYRQIPNYGQYEKVSNSVCFEKILP